MPLGAIEHPFEAYFLNLINFLSQQSGVVATMCNSRPISETPYSNLGWVVE
jgi:hypothetical protein